MTKQNEPRQELFDREARRLEKLRSLRLVEQPPTHIVVEPSDDEFEPQDAA